LVGCIDRAVIIGKNTICSSSVAII